MNEKHHEMIFEQIHASGVEEWSCPSCGRRFLVQWPPAYKTIILEPGDQDTPHNISRNKVRRGSVRVGEVEENGLIEETRLIRWIKWMEEVDFDSWWDKKE
jgi:hypothetical protein